MAVGPRAMRLSLLAAALLCSAVAQDEEEGKSMLLLYKKMDPMEGFAIGEPINVTLSVFNKGPGNAYSLVVTDDNWKADKFLMLSGGNNFSLDYLNAGDQYVHEFTVAPIKKTWHRIRPAKMAFIDGVEGENTIFHMSNTLPDIRIAATKACARSCGRRFARSSPTCSICSTQQRVVTSRSGWSSSRLRRTRRTSAPPW